MGWSFENLWEAPLSFGADEARGKNTPLHDVYARLKKLFDGSQRRAKVVNVDPVK